MTFVPTKRQLFFLFISPQVPEKVPEDKGYIESSPSNIFTSFQAQNIIYFHIQKKKNPELSLDDLGFWIQTLIYTLIYITLLAVKL